MRSILMLAAAAGLVVSEAQAQGWVIPEPCRQCPGPVKSHIVRSSSAVRVALVNQVLQYEVEETFTNRGAGLGEADYYFPLPGTAAFEDLRLSINGQLVSGEVMGAAEARGVYEDIVRRRRDPALVEWMGHGLLHARIFPIGPGEEKRVVVRFQMVAPRDGDALRVDYRRPDLRSASSSDGPASESSFVLRYPVGAGFGEPYSPTHSLRARTSGDTRIVEADGAARDVTILLPVTRSREPAISMIANAPANENGFALITIAPPAILPAALPRDITFVVDVSGSMSGRKIEQARDAGRALLGTLGAHDRFRIIDFSTDVRAFRDGFVSATRDNLAAAARYIDALQAEGSTNLEGALREALSGDSTNTIGARLGVVLLLTDGEPTVGERDPEALARLAAQRRGARRVFTFGLVADVNVSLLEQLSLQGRGTASFLRPDENIERAVSVVATRLRDPVLADVRVHAGGVRLTQMLPAEPPDLFAGQSIVLLARYTGHGRTRLYVEGRTATGPITWTQDVDFPERSMENPFVPRLWATQRVGWLSAERRTHGASPEIDGEIKTLGERYGIPTELTSYLVREPDAVAAGSRGRPPMGALYAPQAAAPAREQQFEAAKRATAMRATLSLAVADSANATGVSSVNANTTVRRVGNRLFERGADSVWTDRRYRPEMLIIQIRAYSAGYFDLLRAMPELRDALSLGERVIVAGRAMAIEIGPTGAMELGAPDRAALREEW